MYEVYRRMPNDTDFTIFKEARLPGLNFAFIGDPQHYHAPSDDVAHLDSRCLQHVGSYALSLARHFGTWGWPNWRDRMPCTSTCLAAFLCTIRPDGPFPRSGGGGRCSLG